MKTTVYKPSRRNEMSFIQTLVEIFNNLKESKFMIFQMFTRDFTVGYKKSFLGIIWVVISPLVSVVAWIFLQKAGLLQPGKTEVPYPVYVLVGTLTWGYFLGIYSAGLGTLGAGKKLAFQVKFPHEAMFFKGVLLFSANYLIRFVIVMIAISFLGVFPSWKIVFVPLVALPVFFLAGSVGLVLSLFSIVTSDVKRVSGVVTKFLIWTVPVLYSSNVENPLLGMIVNGNPLTYLICSMRDMILYGTLYNPPVYFAISAISFIMFLISWRIFFVSEQQLVEKMV